MASAGHVPGAINIPLKDLPGHFDALPRRQEIVVCCRGPYCVLAFDAVARLRRDGLGARSLAEFPEKRREGLPVERGIAGHASAASGGSA